MGRNQGRPQLKTVPISQGGRGRTESILKTYKIIGAAMEVQSADYADYTD